MGRKVDKAGAGQGLAELLLGSLRTAECGHEAVRKRRGELILHQGDFAPRAGKRPELHQPPSGRRSSNPPASSGNLAGRERGAGLSVEINVADEHEAWWRRIGRNARDEQLWYRDDADRPGLDEVRILTLAR